MPFRPLFHAWTALDEAAYRAAFYRGWGKGLERGMTPSAALVRVPRQPLARHEALRLALLGAADTGESIARVFRRFPAAAPEFDRAVLVAAEATGRLPITLKALADYYGTRARIARRTKQRLAPYVVAALLGPGILLAPLLQSAGFPAYATLTTFAVILVLVLGGLVYDVAAARSARRTDAAQALFARGMVAALTAGLTAVQAAVLSAHATCHVALAQGVEAIGPEAMRRQPIASSLMGSPVALLLGDRIIHALTTGEARGEMLQPLEALATVLDQELWGSAIR